MTQKTPVFITIKPKLTNHLRAITPLIFFLIVVGIGLSYFLSQHKLDNNTIIITSPILLIFILPPIYLHLNYWIYEFNSELIINNYEEIITYKRRNKIATFKFSDIECITFFGETKEFNNLTWQNYFFYQIQVKNQENLIITCLSAPKLELILPKHVIRIRKLFADLYFFRDE
jgi:hypothetical protein